MKRLDEMTDRLLRAAAAAPGPSAGGIPDPLLSRIMRQWRENQEPTTGMDFLLFARRVAGYACSLSLLVIALSLLSQKRQTPDAWSIAGTVAQVALDR